VGHAGAELLGRCGAVLEDDQVAVLDDARRVGAEDLAGGGGLCGDGGRELGRRQRRHGECG
jgi:hypothetical protein